MHELCFHMYVKGRPKRGLFQHSADYIFFESLLDRAARSPRVSLYSYSLMPTHWHLVAAFDGYCTRNDFSRWLRREHTSRIWSTRRTLCGQEIYDAPVQSRSIRSVEHFQRACRYVERNALSSKLVGRAEAWRWSSLWWKGKECRFLAEWPGGGTPHDWFTLVNQPMSESERR